MVLISFHDTYGCILPLPFPDPTSTLEAITSTRDIYIPSHLHKWCTIGEKHHEIYTPVTTSSTSTLKHDAEWYVYGEINCKIHVQDGKKEEIECVIQVECLDPISTCITHIRSYLTTHHPSLLTSHPHLILTDDKGDELSSQLVILSTNLWESPLLHVKMCTSMPTSTPTSTSTLVTSIPITPMKQDVIMEHGMMEMYMPTCNDGECSTSRSRATPLSYYPPRVRPLGERDQLLRVLKRENEMRLSAEQQATYASVEDRFDTDWMELTAELQERVVREFLPHDATKEEVEGACHLVRTSQYRYPDDADILNASLYVKYNRARQGDLREGDLAINVPLYDMNGKKRWLFDFHAHANNEWPIGSKFQYEQPHDVSSRTSIAHAFITSHQYEIPMLIDPIYSYEIPDPPKPLPCYIKMTAQELDHINDPFQHVYAPWPIRFYVLHRGRMSYIAQPEDGSYSMSKLKRAVEQCFHA